MRKGITLWGMCSRSGAPEAEMEFGVQALYEGSTSVRRARKWDSTEGGVSLPPDLTKPQPMLQGALGCVLPNQGSGVTAVATPLGTEAQSLVCLWSWRAWPAVSPEDAHDWRLTVTTLHIGRSPSQRGTWLCISGWITACECMACLMPQRDGAETFGSETEQIIWDSGLTGLISMWNFLFPCGDLSREVSEANDHLLLCLQERTPGGEPGAQSLSTSCLMVG